MNQQLAFVLLLLIFPGILLSVVLVIRETPQDIPRVEAGFHPESPGQYLPHVCSCQDRTSELATNERTLSNTYFAQNVSIPDERLTALAVIWGQLVDHELIRTMSNDMGSTYTIAFSPTINMTLRRLIARDSEFHPMCREPKNFNTPVIDGTTVYGTDLSFLNAHLRVSGSCKLRTNPEHLLPDDTSMLQEGIFLAGDVRNSEHAMLTSLHTLMLREHNRLCDHLNITDLSEEEKFWKARQIVVAKLQKITYDEWLPALLGGDTYYLDDISRRKREDGAISAEFAIAFRFGHSMVPGVLGEYTLQQLFMQNGAHEIKTHGIEPILRLMTTTEAQKLDLKVVDGLRNMLFGPMGEDLEVRNMFRSRDVHLASSSEISNCFSGGEITIEPEDPFVGLMSQDIVGRRSLSRLIANIVGDQFGRIRQYDRLFYTKQRHSIGETYWKEIQQTTIHTLIVQNSGLAEFEVSKTPFQQ